MKDFVPVPRLSIRSPCSLHLKDSWRFQIAPPTNRVTFLYHGKKKCESEERERETEGEFGDGRKDFVFTLEPVVYCFFYSSSALLFSSTVCV